MTPVQFDLPGREDGKREEFIMFISVNTVTTRPQQAEKCFYNDSIIVNTVITEQQQFLKS